MPAPRRIRKPMPLLGRRTAWPADSIGQDYSANCFNIRFKFGEARNAPGRNILAGPATAEPVRSISQFAKLDGTTIWPMMLTDTHLFRWGGTIPGTPAQWQQIIGNFVIIGGRIFTTAVGEDHFFFGNGNNTIAQWDGIVGDHFDVVTASDGGVVPKARFLEYFNGRIHGAFNIEGTSTFANRVRWAQNGDFTKWLDTNGLGAGFVDITDERQEPIRGIRGLNGELAVYTRHSIKHMIPTGTLDPTYQVITRQRGIGCDAPYTIASAGDRHFFLGYDHNVWQWDGLSCTPVGYPVWEEIDALVNPANLDTYFGIVSIVRGEYWLVIGTDAFVYDYRRNSWSRDSFPSLTALGEVEETLLAIIWRNLAPPFEVAGVTFVGPWTVQNKTWEELRATVITTLFGGRPDGATMIVDDTTAFDYFAIGSIMDRFLETEDMYIGGNDTLDQDPMRQGTVLRVLLVYKYVTNDQFEIGISHDRGMNWLTQLITPQQNGLSLIDFIATGETIRFRFREKNANGRFRWRSYEYEWQDSGDFIGTV